MNVAAYRFFHEGNCIPSGVSSEKFSIKPLPGDGIGADVVREAICVLNAIAEKHDGIVFDFQNPEWNCQYDPGAGHMMSSDGLKIPADCGRKLIFIFRFPVAKSPDRQYSSGQDST